MNNPVIIIGLDAVNWEILNPMLDSGLCPHISELVSKGVKSDMILDDVLLSPVIWTTIATGKKGIKHGITGFHNDSFDVKSKTIWEIMSQTGSSVGVFQWIVSGPPRTRLNGLNLPAPTYYNDQTFPQDFDFINKIFSGKQNKTRNVLHVIKKEWIGIKSSFKSLRYGLEFNTFISWIYYRIIRRFPKFLSGEKSQLLRTNLKRKSFAEINLFLIEKYKPDLLCYYIEETDHVLHFFWDEYMENLKSNNSLASTKIGSLLEKVDKEIGRIVSIYGKNATYIVVSDHGMERDTEAALYFQTETLSKITTKYKYLRVLKQGVHIYLNVHHSYSGNRNKLLTSVYQDVNNVRIQNSNSKLFKLVSNSLGGLTMLPNVVLNDYNLSTTIAVLSNGEKLYLSEIFIGRKMMTDRSIGFGGHEIQAVHSKVGFFLISGPNIRRNSDLRGTRVIKDVDLLPTILYLSDLPIADDMDGEVIKEIFEPQHLSRQKIKIIDSYENKSPISYRKRGSKAEMPEDVLHHLRKLGYID